MNFRSLPLLILLAFSANAQKSIPLSDLLWNRVGGRLSITQEEGAENIVTDESKNGYLKIQTTEEGCGCYYETVVAAYREADGEYTILQTEWDGCNWQKTLSSNKEWGAILPEDFGLATYAPRVSIKDLEGLNALLYLDVLLPREGTDTTVSLSFVPFGFHFKGDDAVLSFKGYGPQGKNGKPSYRYKDTLAEAIGQLQDSTTLNKVLNDQYEHLVPEDKNILDEFTSSDKDSSLTAYLQMLKNYYEIYKVVEFDTVVLGWNREQERFYIKERIRRKGNIPSFWEFVKQLPFVVALC